MEEVERIEKSDSQNPGHVKLNSINPVLLSMRNFLKLWA
jgi:hypothetical protein